MYPVSRIYNHTKFQDPTLNDDSSASTSEVDKNTMMVLLVVKNWKVKMSGVRISLNFLTHTSYTYRFLI
jgi:hypothetical protein